MTALRGHIIASGIFVILIYDFSVLLSSAETLNLLTWIALINLGVNYLN